MLSAGYINIYYNTNFKVFTFDFVPAFLRLPVVTITSYRKLSPGLLSKRGLIRS